MCISHRIPLWNHPLDPGYCHRIVISQRSASLVAAHLRESWPNWEENREVLSTIRCTTSPKKLGEVLLNNFTYFIRFENQSLVLILQKCNCDIWGSTNRANPVTLILSLLIARCLAPNMHHSCLALRCWSNANLVIDTRCTAYNTSSGALTRCPSIQTLLASSFLLNMIDLNLMALFKANCYSKRYKFVPS